MLYNDALKVQALQDVDNQCLMKYFQGNFEHRFPWPKQQKILALCINNNPPELQIVEMHVAKYNVAREPGQICDCFARTAFRDSIFYHTYVHCESIYISCTQRYGSMM